MFRLNPMFPDATREQKWDQFRIWKNHQLQITDFSQTLDCELSPEDIAEFRSYRSFLRNASSNYENVEDIEFPAYVEMRNYKVIMVKTAYQVTQVVPVEHIK